MGWTKKEERFQKKEVSADKRKKEKRAAKKRSDLGKEGGECTYCIPC
jgi:hypothetical protein